MKVWRMEKREQTFENVYQKLASVKQLFRFAIEDLNIGRGERFC